MTPQGIDIVTYFSMAFLTFALLLYANRRAVFKQSMDAVDEGMFIVLYLVMGLIWPLALPVAVIVIGTKKLMHYLMRGNN